MLSTYQKAIKETTLVRHIVLVFLGALINFIMILPFLHILNQTSLILLITLYPIVGIVYSVIVSLSFHPKRIVSPMHIQILTMVLFMTASTIILVTRGSDLTIVFEEILGYFIISFMVIIYVSMFQTFIVRWLVGLSGTKDDTSSVSLLLNAGLDKVLNVIRKEEVQYTLDLSGEERLDNGSSVFRTASFHEQQLFLALSKAPKSTNKTQMVTISYEKRHYGIIKTPRSQAVGRMKINHLTKTFKEAGITYTKGKDLLPAQLIAHEYALSVTESKLQSFRDMPRNMKIILAGLGIISLAVSVAKYFNWISVELFWTFLIFAGLGVLFNILPLFAKRESK